MKDEFVLGIDIGGTNLRLGAVDRAGTVSFFEKMPSPPILAQNAVENLAAAVRDYLARHSLAGRVAAVSIGVPSTVSRDKSYIYSSPNLLGLQNMDLGREMRARLGVPAFIDRDVNYLLTYDIVKLGLDPERNRTILGFYVGTGLGNAVYLEGHLYAGRHGVAGELGHIPLYREKRPCGCGNSGCCETLCSGYHLADLCREHFPDCPIGEVFTRHGADPVLADFIDTLALPMASEITLLDPDCIVLGGGVLHMADFPMPQLLCAIRRYTRPPFPKNDLDFRFAENSQACGVAGGALVTFQRLDAQRA